MGRGSSRGSQEKSPRQRRCALSRVLPPVAPAFKRAFACIYSAGLKADATKGVGLRAGNAFLLQDCVCDGLHIWAVDGGFGTQREWCDSISCYKCSLPAGLHGAEHIPRMRRDEQEFPWLCAEVR